MTADSVSELLTDKTDVVVPTDMFGHPVDVEAIAETCEDDIFIVRDACQSIAVPEQTIGQDVVDATVVSFQPKKPIGAGHGGAVLIDDPALADSIRTTVSSLEPSDQQTVDALGETYRELYYTVCDLGAIADDAYDLFYDVSDLFRPLFLKQYNKSRIQALKTALDTRHQKEKIRRRHARLYRSQLTAEVVSHPPSPEDTIHYRYSIRLPTKLMRDHVVSRLREQNFHVSTLYRPANLFFDIDDHCPRADRLAGRTLNLWVSSQVDPDYVADCAEAVQTSIQSFEQNDMR
jgi:dTDP-4-amino-4,6-dideoxygalactose transaminase